MFNSLDTSKTMSELGTVSLFKASLRYKEENKMKLDMVVVVYGTVYYS